MTMLLFVIHAIAGSIAILAGISAPFMKKTGRNHKRLGTLFFYSMLMLGLSGALGAFIRDIPLSMMNGLLVCYFVLTSYQTIKQPNNSTSNTDRGLAIFGFALVCGFAYFAVQAHFSATGKLAGFGAPAFIAFGLVTLFASLADVLYLKKGGASGNKRLVRHLWRMFFPLFMSTTAFFLGQAKLFPDALRRIEILVIPVAAVILLMAYWLIKVRFFSAPFEREIKNKQNTEA